MIKYPSVSIIINTDGRVGSLTICLESLRYLRYPNFEVVVVAGPTRDGTYELCESLGNAIKFGHCPERNLSRSRNIAIQISSGEIVAFLDDDSVPEPEWLNDVIPAFADPEVAIAGGFLHNHTGKGYQWRFGTMNRFGGADTSWDRPTPEYNFPFSFNFPHVMANSAIRRSGIIDVGGFDEEYEYFLDESDIICRLVDHGWRVAQLDRGFIHHKFMSSQIRNESRVLTSWYSVVKNKTYFSLLNAGKHASLDRMLGEIRNFTDEYRQHVKWAINEGILPETDLARYEDEVERALRDGLTRGLTGQRRLVPAENLVGDPTNFLRFNPLLPAAKQRCYVFLTRTYPPASLGGIGRYLHHLARSLAAQGYQIHVLTAGEGHDRVDFEEGVWVHRIVVREFLAPSMDGLDGASIPAHIWNYSRTMFAEAEKIAEHRHIDSVYAPLWDVEGVAFLHDHRFPLVTSLQTTLYSYLETNPERRADQSFMNTFVAPMLALERQMMTESDGIHAISAAIVAEIEQTYRFQMDRARLNVVPLGLQDWAELAADEPPCLSPGMIRLCYMGRLESRKGIDLLLQILPQLLADHPEVWLDVVGNDRIPGPDGRTWREAFEADPAMVPLRDRMAFHGEVEEARLRGFYRAADVVLAPSRFESFGLVHLEGMMYGKPVIGCRSGGMVEVIEDGVTGILAEPGDAVSLLSCIKRLLKKPELRQQLGQAARASYLAHFTADRMAGNVIRILDSAARPSLLRISSQACTASQFGEEVYVRFCKEIEQDRKYHRKQWEYIYTLRALEQFGLLKPGARGLGFGCGKEPLAAVMAKHGLDVIVTDIPPLSGFDKHWGSQSAMDLFYDGICSEQQYRERVSFRHVDMNRIPSDIKDFDFVWSCCALEHLGSLKAGWDYVLNSTKCLKPGGIAIHTTEFNVSSNRETLESPGLSIYRTSDFIDLKRSLEDIGCSLLLPLKFYTGDLPEDNYVDLPPYGGQAHIKLMYEQFIITSFGLVIKNSKPSRW